MVNTSLGSPTTSITEISGLKRPGPSSPSGKRKKPWGKQNDGRAASHASEARVNWMAPVTASRAGAKATAVSPRDPYAFIHVESSCK